MATTQPTPDIRDLLRRLTLEEKVSLLAGADWWRTVRIEREGVFVPQVKTSDGPNGARGESYVSGVRAACFPSSSNLGSTFDTELLFRIGQELAEETKSKSADVLLAPTINVVRSPLGGRNYETYGEDPFLLGKLGAACVNGIQSRGVGATPKHYVANEAENKRRTLDVRLSESTLREVYLYPFQIVMKECDPWCFMTSYNRVQGEFVGDSKRLITDVLRVEWGFKGLVMSDWAGTYSCNEPVNAGMDLEMPGPTKHRGKKLLDAISNGEVSTDTIDEEACRVLELIKRADKWKTPVEKPEFEAASKVRDDLICRAAAEGFVLLKNNNSVLPISPGARVAVIGHHAAATNMSGGGSAKLFPLKGVTPLEGFTNAGINYEYSPGVPVYNAIPLPGLDVVGPVEASPSPEIPVLCEWFNATSPDGKPVRTDHLKRPEYMIKEAWPQDLNEIDYCSRMQFIIIPKTTGDHILGVTTTGEADIWVDDEHVYHRDQEMDLIFESYVFHKNTLTRHITYPMRANHPYKITLTTRGASDAALARLRSSQLGSMTLLQGSSIRFYEAYSIPTRLSDAAALAATSDIALVFVGKTDEFESEGYDQASMDLPCDQVSLINAVAASNPNTVVINFSGSPIAMPFAELEGVKGVLQCFYPGQEAGNSIAAVVTGVITPCGKLASSWPVRIEDNPSFGHFPCPEDGVLRYEEGRDVGYRHYDREGNASARWAFGYGLSYTSFEYTEIGWKGEAEIKAVGDKLRLVVSVKNVGKVVGKEIVQVYVAPPAHQVGRGKRPIKELKGFAKVEVRPEETGKVTVELDKYAVSFWDEDRDTWVAEAGTYHALVAKSSVEIVEEVQFSVKEDFVWRGV
ncbi:glycoside hydrolase [Lophium mytilinum]|uniref:beta-glucosidase n=1 Tax=Lophium mytilinum TaxID=390894 RepID=A0A6A6QRK8_9PEZI|nr:glycoside hydrolase [Lophium mytilinum]